MWHFRTHMPHHLLSTLGWWERRTQPGGLQPHPHSAPCTPPCPGHCLPATWHDRGRCTPQHMLLPGTHPHAQDAPKAREPGSHTAMLGPRGLLPCSNTKLLTTPACTKQFPGSRHPVAPVLLGSGACAPSARAPHTTEYCVWPWLWHVCRHVTGPGCCCNAGGVLTPNPWHSQT